MERHMCLRYDGKLGLILRDSNGVFHTNWSGAYVVPWFQHSAPERQTAIIFGERRLVGFLSTNKKSKPEKEREMFPFILWRLLKSQVNDFRDFLRSFTQSGLSSTLSLHVDQQQQNYKWAYLPERVWGPTLHQVNHSPHLNKTPNWFISTLSLRSISLYVPVPNWGSSKLWV